MSKAVVLLCLLALSTVSAEASPAHAAWHFWFSKPERHGSRKLAGDFTPRYGTYRNHSRQDGGGLFSFLHAVGQRHSALARRKSRSHSGKARRRRTSGIF